MTAVQLKASIALWTRRVRWREKQLKRARAHNNTSGIGHYTNLLAQARNVLEVRTHQLLGKSRPARGTWWHPQALKVPGRDAGAFVIGKPRLLWHTTEGNSAAGAIAAYRATGSWPHFTLELSTGKLYQHIPLNRAARALEHPPGGVETNRARCIQVELVEHAANSPKWSADYYAEIAKLARWIEASSGAKRRSSAVFKIGAVRFGASGWLEADGHVGHEHAPNNHHWDPGAMRIDKVV